MSSLEEIKEISRQEGIAKGRAEGLAEGLVKGRQELIRNMLDNGYSEDIVQKALKVSRQEILAAKDNHSENS